MSPVLPLSDIYNFRQVSPDLASSGQPHEHQLAAIAEAGYKVVINLALHNDPRYSLPDEAASVRALGLDYVHIPVQFGAPTASDLEKFFAAMDQHASDRIWVHCAANMRVSAFLGLYRSLRQGWPEPQAFALMHEVWQPDPVWSEFIASQLANAHGAACRGPSHMDEAIFLRALQPYYEAFAESDRERRLHFLATAMTPDAEIWGPQRVFAGYEQISEKIAGFHKNWSGCRLVLTTGLNIFLNAARLGGAIVGPDGVVRAKGDAVIELARDGRIKRVIPFWDALPPLPVEWPERLAPPPSR